MAIQALNDPAFREQFTHGALDLLLSLYTNPDEQKEKLFLAKAKAIGRHSPQTRDVLMHSHRAWQEYHTTACWLSHNVQINLQALNRVNDSHIEDAVFKDVSRLHLYFNEHPRAIVAMGSYSAWKEMYNEAHSRQKRQHAYKTRLRPMSVLSLASDNAQGLNL